MLRRRVQVLQSKPVSCDSPEQNHLREKHLDISELVDGRGHEAQNSEGPKEIKAQANPDLTATRTITSAEFEKEEQRCKGKDAMI